MRSVIFFPSENSTTHLLSMTTTIPNEIYTWNVYIMNPHRHLQIGISTENAIDTSSDSEWVDIGIEDDDVLDHEYFFGLDKNSWAINLDGSLLYNGKRQKVNFEDADEFSSFFGDFVYNGKLKTLRASLKWWNFGANNRHFGHSEVIISDFFVDKMYIYIASLFQNSKYVTVTGSKIRLRTNLEHLCCEQVAQTLTDLYSYPKSVQKCKYLPIPADKQKYIMNEIKLF